MNPIVEQLNSAIPTELLGPRTGCPPSCWACAAGGRQPWRMRFSTALYRRSSLPFRVIFHTLAQVRSRLARHDQTMEESDDYLKAHIRFHGRARWQYGYHRVFSLVSRFHPEEDPRTLKVLSLGPRTEIELYYLWLFFGYSWKNLVGADLVSTHPKIRCADLSRHLPFEDQSFDVIVASHCLEKSRDPERTRDEIRRVAKPGGKVLVGGDRVLGGERPVKPYPGVYFPEGVYGLIRLYGLRMEEIEYLDGRSPHGYEIIFKVVK